MDIFRGILGILVFIGLAYAFSSNRKAVSWRLVLAGVLLQVFFGLLIIKVAFVAGIFRSISEGFVIFLDFAIEGSQFLFSGLALESSNPDAKHGFGVVVAFRVLPTVIFFATVSAGLYYLGVLQKIVYGIAWLMSKTMGLSGSESLSAAGNIFLGQTEAPLLVKPFIPKMTRSELMALMTGGMATIAGAVLATYVAFLAGNDPDDKIKFASHLLGASLMNAPAALVVAKIMIPQTEPEKIQRDLRVSKENIGVNLLDALSRGASDGLKLALNIGGMLLAFIALIAMLNAGFAWIGDLTGLNEVIKSSTNGTFQSFSLEYLLGQLCRPLAFLMGVEWDQTLLMGSLLGQKTVVNEFVAYADLSRMQSEGLLTDNTLLIATYALCGFSNFSSIAIQIAGIGGMGTNEEEQKSLQSKLSKLGLRALLAASIACMMTGTIAGMIS